MFGMFYDFHLFWINFSLSKEVRGRKMKKNLRETSIREKPPLGLQPKRWDEDEISEIILADGRRAEK